MEGVDQDKMPLFVYKFYRKLQEGGTRKTKWSCAKQNTDTEIVESIRMPLFEYKCLPPPPQKKKTKSMPNGTRTWILMQTDQTNDR